MEALIVVCPSCGSEKFFRDGIREQLNDEKKQRYVCRACSRRYTSPINLNVLNNPLELSQICANKVKNLTTATELKTVAGDGKTNLIDYGWQMKKRGIADNTIKVRTYLLEQLIKLGVNLLSPDSFETVLATESMSKAKKRNFVAVYRSYTKTVKIPWEPIKVHYEPKQPFIPTNEEITALISASGKRLATFLQVAKDTGARVGEICQLRWTDVNTKNLTISINNPEKHSLARTLAVSAKTIAMLQALPNSDKYGDRIFNDKPNTIREGFNTIRKRLADNQKNPRFKQIHIHSFRHFYACNLYRKTKILKTVQDALGHKSMLNTEIYTKLVIFREEEYYSATAKTVEEICKLAEDGWSFFAEIDGIKIFRKPK